MRQTCYDSRGRQVVSREEYRLWFMRQTGYAGASRVEDGRNGVPNMAHIRQSTDRTWHICASHGPNMAHTRPNLAHIRQSRHTYDTQGKVLALAHIRQSRHIYDSQGQVLASTFRYHSFKRLKALPPRRGLGMAKPLCRLAFVLCLRIPVYLVIYDSG